MKYLASVEAFTKNPALDVLIILFFLAAGFFLGTLRGKAKLLSFLFGTYVSLFLTPLITKQLDVYKIQNIAWRNLSVYLIVLLAAAIVLNRVIFTGHTRSSFRWWHALFLSFLAVGLFVSDALNLKLARGIVEFSPITMTLFAGQGAYLFWAIAPLAGLVILSRR